MTTPAILMLVFSLTMVWGGLVAAIINLRKHPSPYED
ncbi:methionine/alanine import family NSS transporter small subunit [Luteococcus sp. Sow4_B9]